MIQKSKKNYCDYGMTMDCKIVDSILPLVSGCLVNWSNYIFATILILTPSKNPESSLDSDLELFRPTPHTKNHVIMICMKLKKLLTNKQYQKYLIKNVIQISACVFLLSIVFVAIWQEIF